MIQASKAHLAAVNETYFEHMRFAVTVAALAVGAGLACALHAIIPAYCPKTCSRTVGLLERLFVDRSLLPSISSQSSGVLIFVVLVTISLVTMLVVALCTPGVAIGLILMPQAFALPIIFLSQNRDLEPLAVLTD